MSFFEPSTPNAMWSEARRVLNDRTAPEVKAAASVAAAVYVAIEELGDIQRAVAAACAHNGADAAKVAEYLAATGAVYLLRQAQDQKK